MYRKHCKTYERYSYLFSQSREGSPIDGWFICLFYGKKHLYIVDVGYYPILGNPTYVHIHLHVKFAEHKDWMKKQGLFNLGCGWDKSIVNLLSCNFNITMEQHPV